MTPVRPRVAFVAHSVGDVGGMERAAAELIRHAHADYAFTVVSAELDPSILPLIEQWVRVSRPRRPFPLAFLIFYLKAARALRRLDVDIVHTLGAIVPNRADVATIQFCHAGFREATGALAPSDANIVRRVNTTVGRALALAAEKWSYRPTRLRHYAAVSKGVGAEVTSHYPDVPVSITPNGVDLVRFRPQPDVRDLVRRKEGARADDVVAIFVGGDWNRKGLPIAIRAVREVRRSGLPVQLWVVGAGAVPRTSEEAGEAVRYFGRRPDAERLLAAADVFIFPSSYEAFSLATLEAAASGLPLILTPVNGTEELLQGEPHAGIITARNPAAVTEALQALASDARLRAEMAHAARARAERYTWKNSADSVVSVYERLLTPHGRP